MEKEAHIKEHRKCDCLEPEGACEWTYVARIDEDMSREDKIAVCSYALYTCEDCGNESKELAVRHGKWHEDDLDQLQWILGSYMAENDKLRFQLKYK
jgi:hypothetical protein